MLNFKHKPDAVFTELLTKSLDLASDIVSDMGDEGFRNFYPNSRKMGLTVKDAPQLLDRLNLCHQSSGVYSFNLHHLALIFDALHFYCEYSGQGLVGVFINNHTKINKLNFRGMVNHYFSHEMSCPLCLARQGKSLEEILDCKLLQRHEYAFSENDAPLFNAESTVYPDEESL